MECCGMCSDSKKANFNLPFLEFAVVFVVLSLNIQKKGQVSLPSKSLSAKLG